jgi:hypothetical protein
MRRRLDREVLYGYSATRDIGGYSGSVEVAAVGDVYRRHYASLVVGSEDDPVTCLGRSASCPQSGIDAIVK